MTSIFLLAAVGMTPVTVLLVVSPLLRRQFKAQRRAGEIRVELQTLDAANAAGAMSPAQYAAARHVLGEALLDDVAIEPKRSAPILYSAIAAALLMPLAAFGIYRLRDTPPTLQAHMSTTRTAAPLADHGSDIQASISKLAAKLREQPDDAEGWALLGRTYKATEHYPEARDAFQHAVAAAPGDAGFEREYAAAETPDNASAADESSGGITVKVSLDPKLNAKVSPSDTLFVFAKAAQGPAMPLAIARLTVAQLPASVTLSDSMAMMPSLTLSKFPQIVLGARISKSGNAVPQKGDYQTVSSSLANSSSEPFRLTIDQVVE
jgi:cytochrome c-type biogenesis protein CcmI